MELKKTIALGALLSSLLIAGCTTPDKSYMFNIADSESDCHGSCLTTDGYSLAFVEFDDDGYYHDTRQRNEVFAWVRDKAQAKKPNSAYDGAIIVSYTHGWNHNAQDVSGGNRREFEKVLKNLSEKEKLLTDGINNSHPGTDTKPRRVIGIYTGWRGKSVTTRGIRLLTFWERKKIAQLIGNRDGKDYFSALAAMKKSIDKGDTRLIIVGHSFGALLVHSATTGLMIERFNNTVESRMIERPDNTVESHPDDLFKGLGDLVVLVNPAFEALDIAYMITASNRQQYSSAQRPLFMILASESDFATNIPFRIGRFFTTFFDNYTNELVIDDTLSVDRRRADNRAVGHYEHLRNYTLNYNDSNEVINYQSTGSDPKSPYFNYVCKLWNDWRSDSDSAVIKGAIRDDYIGKDFILRQHFGSDRKKTQKQNPYLVISVSHEILPGHSIDNEADDLLSFVGSMVILRTATDQDLKLCEGADPVSNMRKTIDNLTQQKQLKPNR